MTKLLFITQCPDSMMWYRDRVGEMVAYEGEWPEGYKSREPAGYINVVRFQDAIVVDLADPFAAAVHKLIERHKEEIRLLKESK